MVGLLVLISLLMLMVLVWCGWISGVIWFVFDIGVLYGFWCVLFGCMFGFGGVG